MLSRLFERSNFNAFNFVNKKLKKVFGVLLILGKYTYLCRMNYLMSQYGVFALVQESCHATSVCAIAGGQSVVCCKLNNRAYSTNIEDIVCSECRNV